MLPRFYPDLSDDFLSLLPEENARQPLDAYWRRILDADPAVHGPVARAWHDTERILSEHTPCASRLDLASLNIQWRPARDAVHGSALFPERLFHETGPASGGSRQARGHSRHHRAGPLRPAVSALDLACACRACGRDAEIRLVEGAGHSLYDPGVRDAVMKAIADIASKSPARGHSNMPLAGKGMLLTSMDIDAIGRSRVQPLVRPRASRGARRDRRLSRGQALYRRMKASPKYLCLYSTADLRGSRQPGLPNRACQPDRLVEDEHARVSRT